MILMFVVAEGGFFAFDLIDFLLVVILAVMMMVFMRSL